MLKTPLVTCAILARNTSVLKQVWYIQLDLLSYSDIVRGIMNNSKTFNTMGKGCHKNADKHSNKIGQ